MTVQLLEDTPPVLSLGQSCEEHRYSLESIEGPKLHLFKNCKKIPCHSENYVPTVVSGLSRDASSSSAASVPISSSAQDSARKSAPKSPVHKRKIQENGLPHGKTRCVMGYRRKNTTLYAELRCMICPDGYASSPKIVRMEKLQR